MLYDRTITPFVHGLGALDSQLDKARVWAADQGRTEADLLTARLAPDMFPLATQIRFTCAQALQAAARLGAGDPPEFADDAADFAAAKGQIAEARAFLEAVPTDALAAGDAPVEFTLPNGMNFALSAADYVRDWSLPQFYFHAVAAYTVLRHAGVPLGKADYVPYMLRHLKAPAAAE